jgi:hypothetical protein
LNSNLDLIQMNPPAPAPDEDCHQCLLLLFADCLLLNPSLELSSQRVTINSPQASPDTLRREPVGGGGQVKGNHTHRLAFQLRLLLQQLQGKQSKAGKQSSWLPSEEGLACGCATARQQLSKNSLAQQ